MTRKKRKKTEEPTDVEGNHYEGQFYVLLWPQMKKVKGLNWNQAEKLWKEHTDRVMIFSMRDLKGDQTIETA